MKTEIPTQLLAALAPDDATALPWQRALGPGDRCVIPIPTDGGETRFAYLAVQDPPPEVPPGYLYGDCYSDLAPDPARPGVGAVHPSLVLQPISADQFEAARRTGFRSAPVAVMAILNYSHRRGEA